MIHNGLCLISKTDWAAPHFPLRSLTGDLLDKECPAPLLRDLAERGLVCGIGSNARVKRFQYLVDQSEAERALRASVVTHATRARTPGDLLARMVRDRQTVKRTIKEITFADRSTRRVVLFAHKG